MQHDASLPAPAPDIDTKVPGPDDRDDGLLIEAAQRDPAAIVPLYQRYVRPIYRYLYSRVGNVQDTEDLTSQVFLEALRGLPRYHHRGNFAAWLFTIARRRAGNHYRRQPVLFDLDDAFIASDEADPLAQVIHVVDLEQLRGLMARLNERDQELLRLRYAGGLTFAQMAATLGKREGAVKMAMQRLLARLQRALGGEL
jgi:RNA polymerase sigma-70 factor, ECF subfamily